jgi:hypothetical protein
MSGTPVDLSGTPDNLSGTPARVSLLDQSIKRSLSLYASTRFKTRSRENATFPEGERDLILKRKEGKKEGDSEESAREGSGYRILRVFLSLLKQNIIAIDTNPDMMSRV